MKKKSKSDMKSTKRPLSKMSTSEADIVSLILRDHKPIKELILILKAPEVSIAKKKPAFVKFERALSSHAEAEEESLYIYLKKVNSLRTEGIEGDTEHSIAVQLMKEVNESDGDDATWMAKVKVLAELVDHHVKEEEKEVLKEVRKIFSADKRIEMGELYSQLLHKHQDEPIEPQKLSKPRMMSFLDHANGKVGIPILLYLLGVPGVIVLGLWAVFFRDR